MNASKLIRYNANKRQLSVALVFCIFFGMLGLHRFYVNKKDSGLAMLILTLVVIGIPISFVWSVVDLFFVPDMISAYNNDLVDKIDQHYFSQEKK
ncbi:MAG: TM2 domain-containing protein [Prevotellaceae bacterium]|jgi:TM2 domain-containing membrane protein YozV|nr:TM2 domain-containing protein [Prevotellaceae bacterium]